MKKIFVLLFLLIVISWTAQATIYYIDPSGIDGSGRNGSASQPWLHLSYACTRATSAGDIIHINPGSYNETSQSVLAVGVSIEGAGNTSIISSTFSGESGTILLASATQGTNGNQSISYIKMDGNSLTSHIAIEVNARSNVKIHHCEIVNFLSWGVILNGLTNFGASAPSVYATGNEFYNNIVTNCAGYGGGYGHGNLAVGGQLGLLVHDNTITQTVRGGAYTYGWCYKYYSDGYSKGVKIYNNTFIKPAFNGDWDFAMEFCEWEQGGCEIYNNVIEGAIDLGARRKGNYAFSIWIHHNIIGKLTRTNVREAGIIFENVTEDAIVEYNYFKNISHGIGIHGGDVGDHATNLYIRYNIFDQMGNSNESWGMYWYSGNGNGTENKLYFDNNIFTSYPGSPMGIGLALPPTEHATDVYVRNNIFVGFSYAFISAYGSGTMDRLYLQNNILYQNGNSNNPLWEAPYSPTNVTSTNNLKTNPLFVTPNSDYHLQAGSPAIDAGLDIGLLLDYDGNAVPFNTKPDIGAFEYGSSPPSTTLPVYQSSSIENATPSVLEITYSLSLANIVPATSAFSVMVNSIARPVSTVTISGTKVMLTLSSSVVYGDVVTVAYTKPATNPLQTVSGGEAATLGAQSVNNNCLATIPVYQNSVIENATPSTLEMTYSLTLANIVPSTSAFTVMVNSVARSVSSVAISGNKVLLTLSSSVISGDAVTVAYVKPGSNPLQTGSGGLAATLTAQTVTNNVAVVPVYLSSVVENATPSILTITYSLSLANVVPASSAFSVKVNTVTRNINLVAITGGKVVLTLASPVYYGDAVTVAYTKPGTNPLQTTSGGQASSIIAQTVTNNCANNSPSVLITSPGNGSTFTAPATINIAANASDVDGTISKVEFYNGATKLGEKTTSPYTFTWSGVAVGIYSLTAVATDNFGAKTTSVPVSVTVNTGTPPANIPPVVNLTDPANNSSYIAPATILITATASDPDGTISKVEFFHEAIKLGESTSSPYSYTWNSVASGSYTLTAIATDNLSATTTSATVSVNVAAATLATLDSINLYPNPNDGNFTVSLNNPMKDDKSTVTVVGPDGKRVYEGFMLKEETSKEFQLSHINTGKYVFIISGKEIIAVKKFIKK
jgi:uncharacterized repeat protein (TIGR02059 family)